MPPSTSDLRNYFGATTRARDPNASIQFLREHPGALEDFDAVFAEPGFDELPTRIGRFELRSILGRGGMAVVVRAFDTERGGDVALKLARIHQERSVQALREESRGLARVDHPHVVRVHSFGEVDGFCWMAMELVQGRSLAGWIAEAQVVGARRRFRAPRLEPRRLATVLRWTAELASGLAAVHAAGLVHRDIKPSNVMIREDGSACLIDFGLVQDEGVASWSTRVLEGTLPYMSPEQTLGGLLAVDRGSDVYALAATMYEALCGRRTVDVKERDQLLVSIAFGEVPEMSRWVRGVPVAVRAIFARALLKDRTRRYPDAEQLVEDLQAHLAGRPTVHARPALGGRLREFCRRRAGLVAAGVAVVGFAALFWGRTAWLHAEARGELLAAVEDRFGAQERRDGLELLATGLEEFGGDAGFVSWCAENRVALLDHATSVILGELGPRVRELEARTDFASLDALAAYLCELPGNQAFTFLVVLLDYYRNGAESALGLLDQRRGDGPPELLVLDLECLLHAVVGDQEAYLRCARSLEGISASALRLDELLFRATRLIVAVGRARSDPGFVVGSTDGLLEEAELVLRLFDRVGSPSLLSSALGALVAMERGDYGSAAGRLDALVSEIGTPPPWIGLYHVLGAALHADGIPVDPLAALLARYPEQRLQLAWWLAGQCASFGRPALAVDLVLAEPGLVPRGAVEIRQLAAWGARLAGDEDWVRADLALERILEIGSQRARSAELRPLVGSLLGFWIWTGVRHLDREVATGRPAPAEFVRGFLAMLDARLVLARDFTSAAATEGEGGVVDDLALAAGEVAVAVCGRRLAGDAPHAVGELDEAVVHFEVVADSVVGAEPRREAEVAGAREVIARLLRWALRDG